MKDQFEALLGAPVAGEGEWRFDPAPPGLPISVSLTSHDVLVDLGGCWSWRGELSDAPDERAEDLALALDLVGAALFGDVRVRQERVGSRVHRCTLELRRVTGRRGGDGTLTTEWSVVGSRGGPAFNPFARRSALVLRNQVERPAACAFAPLEPALPWAPWAGAASYTRPSMGDGDVDAASAELWVDGELDLHNFHPKEVKPLVLEYIEVCKARGIVELRVVHGKGKGVLRRTVHALLTEHPDVEHFELGGHDGGSWGATVVTLRQIDPKGERA